MELPKLWEARLYGPRVQAIESTWYIGGYRVTGRVPLVERGSFTHVRESDLTREDGFGPEPSPSWVNEAIQLAPLRYILPEWESERRMSRSPLVRYQYPYINGGPAYWMPARAPNMLEYEIESGIYAMAFSPAMLRIVPGRALGNYEPYAGLRQLIDGAFQFPAALVTPANLAWNHEWRFSPQPENDATSPDDEYDAEARARQLAIDVMGQDVYEEYERTGYVIVETKSGNRYKLKPYYCHLLDHKKRDIAHCCIESIEGGLPSGDSLAGRWLLLVNDEERFLETSVVGKAAWSLMEEWLAELGPKAESNPAVRKLRVTFPFYMSLTQPPVYPGLST